MNEKLATLSKRLKDEQRDLLLAAAEQNTIPSASTIQRVAMLELDMLPLRIPSPTDDGLWRRRRPAETQVRLQPLQARDQVTLLEVRAEHLPK
jgi:hypothetical protein